MQWLSQLAQRPPRPQVHGRLYQPRLAQFQTLCAARPLLQFFLHAHTFLAPQNLSVPSGPQYIMFTYFSFAPVPPMPKVVNKKDNWRICDCGDPCKGTESNQVSWSTWYCHQKLKQKQEAQSSATYKCPRQAVADSDEDVLTASTSKRIRSEADASAAKKPNEPQV